MIGLLLSNLDYKSPVVVVACDVWRDQPMGAISVTLRLSSFSIGSVVENSVSIGRTTVQ